MYAKEKAPTTGHVHHQGWVQFEKPITWHKAKTLLDPVHDQMHVENCGGSAEENEIYCLKDDLSRWPQGPNTDITRFGEFVSMGQRTDVDAIHQLLKTDTPMLEIADQNFPLFCRSHNAFQKYRTLHVRTTIPEWRALKTVVLAGPTGVGKTRLAATYSPFIISGSQTQWWDGYSQEDVLLIDDTRSKHIPLAFMLRILDGYELRLPIKGGFTYAAWTKVIITTNEKTALYKDEDIESFDAFMRRVTNYYWFFNSERIPDCIQEFRPVEIVPPEEEEEGNPPSNEES